MGAANLPRPTRGAAPVRGSGALRGAGKVEFRVAISAATATGAQVLAYDAPGSGIELADSQVVEGAIAQD